MAADSLLAALQGNYGNGEPLADDVNTVRGLLSFCKGWIERRVVADELNNPCLAMAGRLRGGAKEMETDLRNNPTMSSEMSEPITRTMEAYRAIADVLEELPELAKDENVNDFIDDLEVYEEERQAVLDAQELIQFQLSGKARLCPKCGSTGEEELCPTCQLVRLYPDPQGAKPRAEMQARLSGLYAKVFRYYVRVLAGERSLPRLWEALGPLEDHLDTLISTRKQLRKRIDSKLLTGQRRSDARAAEILLSGAEAEVKVALRGVERMKAAETSFRISDLSRGWEDIFHAAQVIELTAARIRRRLGDEDEPVPGPSPEAAGDDMIAFSGE